MAAKTPGRIPQAVKQWMQLTLQTLLGILLFALLLVGAQRTNQRYDLTPMQQYSLSDEARQVVEGLEEPVAIKIFYDGGQQGYRRSLEDRLSLFAEASPHLTYRLIDLDRHPREAEQYDISSYNTGIIESARGLQRLRAPNQESITAALLKLSRKDPPTLCFVTGHGEQDPRDNRDRFGYSRVAKALEAENYRVASLDYVPPLEEGARCDVLAVAGPKNEMLPAEVDNLIARLRAGRAILFMIDPQAPASAERFLQRAGVRVFDDLIVDERSRFYGADSFMPRVGIIDESVFGNRLGDSIFALARTVRPGDEGEVDASVRLLAVTGQETWARFGDLEITDREVEFRRDTDKPGPLPVGLLLREPAPAADADPSAEPPAPVGPMVVFGDSDFANNLYLDLFGNRDLFMSTIAVLTRQDNLVGRRQDRDALNFPVIALTDEQIARVFRVGVLWMPAAAIALGMLVSWRRRRRTGT
jgi:hypothetical protein